MIVTIAPARERSSIKFPGSENLTREEKTKILQADKRFVEILIQALIAKFGLDLSIVSFGCDDGTGLLVKSVCLGIENPLDLIEKPEEGKPRKKMKFNPICKFQELVWYFHGTGRVTADYVKFYLARNATVTEITDIFVLLTNKKVQSMPEDILDRILKIEHDTGESRPYMAIDESFRISRTNMTPTDYFIMDNLGRIVLDA